MSTAERYADELVDLAKSDRSVSDGLVRFEQIFDAYMIETPGEFVAKRRALLNAFQARTPDGELASLIVDKLGGMP
jgi:hypothetical protein